MTLMTLFQKIQRVTEFLNDLNSSERYRESENFRRFRALRTWPSSSNRENGLQYNTNHRERQVNKTMRNIIDNIKSTYGNLSTALIEVYYTEKYYRFYKGHQAKVSLATACFYMGQGFILIHSIVQWYKQSFSILRTAILNRLKQRIVSELKANIYR